MSIDLDAEGLDAELEAELAAMADVELGMSDEEDDEYILNYKPETILRAGDAGVEVVDEAVLHTQEMEAELSALEAGAGAFVQQVERFVVRFQRDTAAAAEEVRDKRTDGGGWDRSTMTPRSRAAAEAAANGPKAELTLTAVGDLEVKRLAMLEAMDTARRERHVARAKERKKWEEEEQKERRERERRRQERQRQTALDREREEKLAAAAREKEREEEERRQRRLAELVKERELARAQLLEREQARKAAEERYRLETEALRRRANLMREKTAMQEEDERSAAVRVVRRQRALQAVRLWNVRRMQAEDGLAFELRRLLLAKRDARRAARQAWELGRMEEEDTQGRLKQQMQREALARKVRAAAGRRAIALAGMERGDERSRQLQGVLRRAAAQRSLDRRRMAAEDETATRLRRELQREKAKYETRLKEEAEARERERMKRVEQERRRVEEERRRKERRLWAVLLLQRAVRCWSARRALQGRREAQRVRLLLQFKAAAGIQALWRGVAARRSAVCAAVTQHLKNWKRVRWVAAAAIQALVRGRRVRRKLKEIRQAAKQFDSDDDFDYGGVDEDFYTFEPLEDLPIFPGAGQVDAERLSTITSAPPSALASPAPAALRPVGQREGHGGGRGQAGNNDGRAAVPSLLLPEVGNEGGGTFSGGLRLPSLGGSGGGGGDGVGAQLSSRSSKGSTSARSNGGVSHRGMGEEKRKKREEKTRMKEKKIKEEWGFSDPRTAALMLKRAKKLSKMKYAKKVTADSRIAKFRKNVPVEVASPPPTYLKPQDKTSHLHPRGTPRDGYVGGGGGGGSQFKYSSKPRVPASSASAGPTPVHARQGRGLSQGGVGGLEVDTLSNPLPLPRSSSTANAVSLGRQALSAGSPQPATPPKQGFFTSHRPFAPSTPNASSSSSSAVAFTSNNAGIFSRVRDTPPPPPFPLPLTSSSAAPPLRRPPSSRSGNHTSSSAFNNAPRNHLPRALPDSPTKHVDALQPILTPSSNASSSSNRRSSRPPSPTPLPFRAQPPLVSGASSRFARPTPAMAAAAAMRAQQQQRQQQRERERKREQGGAAPKRGNFFKLPNPPAYSPPQLSGPPHGRGQAFGAQRSQRGFASSNSNNNNSSGGGAQGGARTQAGVGTGRAPPSPAPSPEAEMLDAGRVLPASRGSNSSLLNGQADLGYYGRPTDRPLNASVNGSNTASALPSKLDFATFVRASKARREGKSKTKGRRKR